MTTEIEYRLSDTVITCVQQDEILSELALINVLLNMKSPGIGYRCVKYYKIFHAKMPPCSVLAKDNFML